MYIILTISVIALILLIWFKTNAWIEYTDIFNFKINNEYKRYIDNVDPITFTTYIRTVYYERWIIRLITCPICLGTWLGIIAGLITTMSNTPIFICGGILLYAAMNKLLE